MGIKIRVLELGTTYLDYELAVSGHPDRLLNRERTEGRREWFPQPIYAWIIEHPEGRILVDTGVNPNWAQEWKHPWYPKYMAHENTPDGYFHARLQQLHLSVDDFRYVVLTHLHTDHAGNARLFKDTKAKILVHEDELKGAVKTKLSLLRDDVLTAWGVTSPQGFTRHDFAFLVPDRATTVYGDQEIAKDVWIISLPGHTWGTMGVAVNLPHSGWVLIASDALYTTHNYGPPFVGSIVNHDHEKWAHSALKIRRLAEQYNMIVLPGHDDHVLTNAHERIADVAPLRLEYE